MKSSNKLSMHRGDTARFYFQRLDAEGNVITTKADELYFTVKSSTQNTNYEFQIRIDDMEFDEEDGTYHFTVQPEDTNGLNFTRMHYYDVEVIDSGVKTTIALGEFHLKPEVTWAVNEGDESE